MNNDRIHKQIESLLTRWGYRPIEGDLKLNGEPLSSYAKDVRDQKKAELWGLGPSQILFRFPSALDFRSKFRDFCKDLSQLHSFSQSDVRRMIEAEPIDRDLGPIELHPQPLTEWGDREDHAEATIVMDARGRDRLIAALIEGRDAIEVYGESGGGYALNLRVNQEN